MRQFTLALLFPLATMVSLAAQDLSQLPSAPEPQPSEFDQQAGEKAGKAPQRVVAEAGDLTKKMGELAMVKARDWESGWLTGVFVKKGERMTPLTLSQRRVLYLQQTLITPGAYMKRMFAAGIDQARGVPHPWDTAWDGYLDRFASREGQFITANSLAALGNVALKYEPRYDRCQCKGVWPRSRHAILRNFITFNQTEVDRRPQLALYGGAFAGGALASVWKPHPRNALADGGWAVLGQAGYGSLLNFFIEFAGEINQKIGVKKQQVPPY